MIRNSLKIVRLSGVAEQLRDLGDAAGRISADVVNDTVDFAFDRSKELILDDVMFPSGYLELGNNFQIKQRATESKPVASITARHRATSLARFVVGSPQPYARGGVKIRIRRGGATHMRNAWVTGLNKGNRGVATRVRPGGTIPGRKKGTRGLPVLRKDERGTTYLLYGPSVNQVFEDVSGDVKPEVAEYMSDQFFRRYKRELKKR